MASTKQRKTSARTAHLASAAMLLFPIWATAGNITGTVDTLITRASDGLTYVQINAVASGHPSCATGSYWIIKDESSEAGKKQYAMLLAAKLSGTPIKIIGSNTCTRWADGEDIDEMYLIS